MTRKCKRCKIRTNKSTQPHQIKSTTVAGKNWAVLALDPFHDTDVALSGYPDQTHVATATQNLKRIFTITQPPGLGAGETWSCHIHSLPVLSSQDMRDDGVPRDWNDFQSTAADPSHGLGMINVITHHDNEPSYQNGSTYTEAYHEFIDVNPTDDNGDVAIRLVGGGFEVHNDTPELYKSGSVTVYSQPNHWSEPFLGSVGSDAADRIGSVRTCRTPPTEKSQAVLFPDARTWSACDGCYVPLRLDISEGNSFRNRDSTIPCLLLRDTTSATDTQQKVVERGSLINATHMSASHPWLSCPIETTGAYFSGLSRETVLTLDVRFFTEVAPTAATPSMLSMCRPSPDYDPTALACYVHCLNTLPPGVPVSMNARGDFWRMVLNAAATAAPVIAPVAGLFGPEAALAAELAALTLTKVNNQVKKKQAEKKQAKKTPRPPAKTAKKSGPNNTYRR